MAALEDNNLPAASSYKLPIGRASADILADIDSSLSSSSSGICSCKSSKLFQYQGVRRHKFYWFQGEELTNAKALNRHIAELAGLRSFDNLNKTDVVWSSTEMEDVGATARFIIEATSWMDWWTYAMRSLALKSTSDGRLVCRVSLAGARCSGGLRGGGGGGALGAAAMGPCQKGAHKVCQTASQISEFILDFSIQLSK